MAVKKVSFHCSLRWQEQSKPIQGTVASNLSAHEPCSWGELARWPFLEVIQTSKQPVRAAGGEECVALAQIQIQKVGDILDSVRVISKAVDLTGISLHNLFSDGEKQAESQGRTPDPWGASLIAGAVAHSRGYH